VPGRAFAENVNMSESWPGMLYTEQTFRSKHKYCFSEKHHAVGDSPHAQWKNDLRPCDEFAVFDLADLHNIADEQGRDLFGVHCIEAAVRQLGTRGEYVAKFEFPTGPCPWHGYPLWPIKPLSTDKNVRHGPAPQSILRKLADAGVISQKARRRLSVGKHP
jgi:hypothetical protein